MEPKQTETTMKKLLCTLLAVSALLSCAKPSTDSEQQKEEEQALEWRGTYNGDLLEALGGAYSVWEQSGKVPNNIKWEGLNVTIYEYYRAGVALLCQMFEQPTSWAKEDVSYPKATVKFVSTDPFLPTEIPFSEFEAAAKLQLKAMSEGGAADEKFTIGQYSSQMSSTAFCVMMCRAAAYYCANGKFPETIDTWEASYLRSTLNCPVDDPLVKETRDLAFKAAGVTESSTARQKAEAIFNYARDQWEWENYYDTKKGAVEAIKTKGGNCCDLSHAVVAMARLSGIPSRYFHAQCKFSSGVIGHVVSQLFVDNEWLMADASNNSNTLGTVVFTSWTNDEYLEELPW